MNDRVEHRYLGAIRFVDRVTGAAIRSSITVAGEGVRLWRNRSELTVIASAPGFAAYTSHFETAPVVESRAVPFNCNDPSGHYLPRAFSVRLPRDPDPEHRNSADSLFVPVQVPLYPAPQAVLGVNWSALRVSLTRQSDRGPLAGALLRVVRDSDGVLLGSGFSDRRGEAVVAVAGIPITDFAAGDSDAPATGSVLVSEVPATLEICCDPKATWPLDCDAIEKNHAACRRETRPVLLATGRIEKLQIELAV